MTKCKYYNEKYCSENCKEEWVRCGLCNEFLDNTGEDDELNGYEIFNGSITCDDSELSDSVMIICPECFERVKQLKKRRLKNNPHP